MSLKREDDAFERSFTSISAKTADITGEFKKEFLKKQGAVAKKDFFHLKR